MIYYLAADLTVPPGIPSYRCHQRLYRLRQIAAALDVDSLTTTTTTTTVGDDTQAVSPHIEIALYTDHGHAPPRELLVDHAQALLIGLASNAARTPATVLVVDPEQAPTVAAQIKAARDLGLPVERPDAGRLARLELGVTQGIGGPPRRLDPIDVLRAEAKSGEDARLERMDLSQLWPTLHAYFQGAGGVCGTGAIQPDRVGGGGMHRARAAQVVVGLQIAQAAGVFRQARKDPRWLGQSRTAGGGRCVAGVTMTIEDRLASARRSEAVVQLRYEGHSHARAAAILGISIDAAKRTWRRASGALRDALADRVALRDAFVAAGGAGAGGVDGGVTGDPQDGAEKR